MSGEGFTPEIAAKYNEYIAELNAAGANAVESALNQNRSHILRPVDATMQDLLGSDPLPSSPPMAPEPSPFFALLAFTALMGVKWLWQKRG